MLKKIEKELPRLLKDKNLWKSLYIDYHQPFVERIWTSWGDYRIYLHRILPCAEDEALLHPHPWPSVMKVFGRYIMKMAFGQGKETPPVFSRIFLGNGDVYDMTHPDGWHAVAPIAKSSFSLMITGQPWNRWSPSTNKQLRPLTPEEERKLFRFFRTQYPERKKRNKKHVWADDDCGQKNVGGFLFGVKHRRLESVLQVFYKKMFHTSTFFKKDRFHATIGLFNIDKLKNPV